jgi:hypothetical protein
MSMRAGVLTEPTSTWWPQRSARLAGSLYLLVIVGGFFAIGVVPALLIVPGDAIATAGNIRANESLYRLGLVAHVLILLANVPIAVIFFDLFRVVNRRVAALMAVFLVVGTSVEGASLLDQFAPLAILTGSAEIAFSREQVEVLAALPLATHVIGYDIYAVFFGCYGLALGYLVFGSSFMPRLIGVLLALGATCYLVRSFSSFLAPDLAASLVPFILLPSLVGEGSLSLWLLARGVSVERWQERAAA